MTEDWVVFGSALAISAGVLGLLAATMVWRTVHDKSVRRRFVFLFLAEALMAFTCLPGPAGFITDADLFHLIHRLHFLNDSLLLAAYLPAVALGE